MKGLTIAAVVLLILFLIALIPIGIHAQYENELRLWLKVGPWQKDLDQLQNRKKKPKAKKKSPGAQKNKAKKGNNNQKIIGLLRKNWREILSMIGRICKAPTLDVLRLEVLVGHEDPAQCAIEYGRICAVCVAVLPVVEHTFRIKTRQVDIRCCFDRSRTQIAADGILSLKIYQIMALAVSLLGLGIKILRQMSKEKRRCQNESSSS